MSPRVPDLTAPATNALRFGDDYCDYCQCRITGNRPGPPPPNYGTTMSPCVPDLIVPVIGTNLFDFTKTSVSTINVVSLAIGRVHLPLDLWYSH